MCSFARLLLEQSEGSRNLSNTMYIMCISYPLYSLYGWIRDRLEHVCIVKCTEVVALMDSVGCDICGVGCDRCDMFGEVL